MEKYDIFSAYNYASLTGLIRTQTHTDTYAHRRNEQRFTFYVGTLHSFHIYYINLDKFKIPNRFVFAFEQFQKKKKKSEKIIKC